MSNDISRRLASLPQTKTAELQSLWREVFHKPAPPKMRRDLLVCFIAYRMQEQSFGGLSIATRKQLRQLADDAKKRSAVRLQFPLRIKPGTRLIREWQGETHAVTLLENGYEYRGDRFASLSEIARLITGTRWSGPRFFGLNGTNGKEQPDAR